ncbi:ATP-dependent nuclease [Myroides marinus]|uniref:ATP-dependent nuclease n=1 Tax=Myroides marinus TaxID=703342 RepID=UPI002574DB1F|nr:AAA family ATPase [Myroides marinus]MDM1380984.1 AAA family ATPase [Myroides marinus]MDM1388255.1 AAA family ATPase [Myroides marinus]MDM1395468.1 AAA family ATPase [Myroides marinus]
MKFTYFRFKNFKGIEDEKIDLSKNPDSNIFTLVGLNESGKTTILEAINFFKYKSESLDVLELKEYEVKDIHSLIPINKRDNFNGTIWIEAGIELDENDIDEIKKEFKKKNITISEIEKKITYTQKYFFENSKHISSKDKFLWDNNIIGRKKGARKNNKLTNADALIANTYIIKKIPSILYFPNFLFDFPEKIYLNDDIDDEKHLFYQKIIQDTLDSLNNDLNIYDHLILRIDSSDDNDKRNLNSLIGKLQKKLTTVIFHKWNQIFNKNLSEKEIILLTGNDNIGTYLEFNIKDDVDTYRISERSLGFRWFFVYILLTQFRSYRKENKNALFLFDEPASNLHPSAQLELLKSFEKLPKVIYTTHSQYLINPKWLESTFVIKNDAIDYENEEDFNSKNTNIKIRKYREFSVKHPDQSSYFQPILEVLDYKPSNLDLVPKIVITEGKNDFYTLNYFEQILNKENKINIIPGTSASNLETLISLYLGWGAKFIVILDDDKEGNLQKKRYIDNFGDVVCNSIFTLFDINQNWKKFELEDIITQNDQKEIVEKIYSSSKVSKTLLNRSLQELYIKNISLELSEETNENFKKIFNFFKTELDRI